jgi:hypothetical protein
MKMMMMTNKFLLILLLTSVSASAWSQKDSDFGMWNDISLKHDILKNLEAEITGDLRTNNMSRDIEQVFGQAGLDYRLSDHFSIGGAYRLIRRNEGDDGFFYRHRLMFDFIGESQIKRVELTGRIRFQRTTKTYIEDSDDLNPDGTVRMRLILKYKPLSNPFRPYLYYEAFSHLKGNEPVIGKNRLSGGLDLKLTRNVTVGAGYIFQTRSSGSNEHILSVSSTIKF